MLNVDNETRSGALLLEPEWRDYEDSHLVQILESIPCDVSAFADMFKLEVDNALCSIEEFEDKYNTRLGAFYQLMTEIVRSNNSKREIESSLNMSTPELARFVLEKGSATPLRSGSESSTETTGGEVGRPARSRTIRFDTSEQASPGDSQKDPSYSSAGSRMPKSTSMKSIVSNLSDEMEPTENSAEAALHSLLNVITRGSRGIRVLQAHRRHRISFGQVEGPVSENDGQISLSPFIRNTNNIPLVNVECKSRAGASGSDILSKIYAQEFGECLAIVQKRMNHVKNHDWRHSAIRSVYSIGAHGRRAYLVLVVFSSQYLDNLDADDLQSERVRMIRSDRAYRLDRKEELAEFITLIYRLCKQLEQQVAAGRRH